MNRNLIKGLVYSLFVAVFCACGNLDLKQTTSTISSTATSSQASATSNSTIEEVGTARFYMIVFGYQDRFAIPRHTHTFATFIKGNGQTNIESLRWFTISWLPADLSINLPESPKRGRNFSLAESLGIAFANGFDILATPVYEIDQGLYERAVSQYRFLTNASITGAVNYTVLDRYTRDSAYQQKPGGAINCIHAVSDIGGYLETGRLRGFAASRLVRDHLSPHIINQRQSNAWIARLLGLNMPDIPL